MLIGKALRGWQVGSEATSTQGTLVPANRTIKNGTFSNKRVNNVKQVEVEGHRSSIGVQRGKRWSEWTLTGVLGYTIFTYLGVGLFDIVSPSNPAVGAYTWTFLETNYILHTPQTFTFEYGNSLGSNSKFPFGTLTDLSIKVSESELSYSAAGFGAYPVKNITMTALPTIISPVIVSLTDCRISFATTFSGLSTGKILTAKAIEMNIKGKYSSQIFIDDATTSIGGILEKNADCSGSITVAEGSESDYFLGSLESSTLCYVQLRCTGPLLQVGTPNTYNTILKTWAVFFDMEEEGNTNELFTGKYNFYLAEDPVNNDINMSVTNYLSGL